MKKPHRPGENPRRPSSGFFEHTADIGLEIRAPDPESLFAEAARALIGFLGVSPPGPGAAAQTEEIRFPGRRMEDLLVDWLSEVIYRAQERRQIPGESTRFRFDGEGLTVHAAWIPPDPGASRIEREIKGVTYHRLEVVRDSEGWRARLILDV